MIVPRKPELSSTFPYLLGKAFEFVCKELPVNGSKSCFFLELFPRMKTVREHRLPCLMDVKGSLFFPFC